MPQTEVKPILHLHIECSDCSAAQILPLATGKTPESKVECEFCDNILVVPPIFVKAKDAPSPAGAAGE